MKDSEVLAYLRLVYNRVDRIMGTSYYACYDKTSLYTYYVADSEGSIVFNFKVSYFDAVGPFFMLSTTSLINEVKQYSQCLDDTNEQFSGSKLVIRKDDAYATSIEQVIKSGNLHSAVDIEPLSCESYDGRYQFYRLKHYNGVSALFDANGYQLTPFFYAISRRLKSQGKYILINVKSVDNYFKNKEWFSLKYDKTLNKIVDFGSVQLTPTVFKTVVRFESSIKNYQLYAYASFSHVGMKRDYKAIWQLTDINGTPVSACYESIEKCGMTVYDEPLLQVRALDSPNRCFGYITTGGFELVAPGKFLIAESIGSSGMFNVVESLSDKKPTFNQKQGIWDGLNQEMVQELSYNTRYLWKELGVSRKKLPIMMCLRQLENKFDYSFVGNDGRLYNRVQDAFEFYRGGGNIYAVILYGKKYYCEIESFKKLRVLDTPINESDYQWQKV